MWRIHTRDYSKKGNYQNIELSFSPLRRRRRFISTHLLQHQLVGVIQLLLTTGFLHQGKFNLLLLWWGTKFFYLSMWEVVSIGTTWPYTYCNTQNFTLLYRGKSCYSSGKFSWCSQHLCSTYYNGGQRCSYTSCYFFQRKITSMVSRVKCWYYSHFRQVRKKYL